jgi:hypothetical protein
MFWLRLQEVLDGCHGNKNHSYYINCSKITIYNRCGMVWASLPLEKGRILDPFCCAHSQLWQLPPLAYNSVGVEIYGVLPSDSLRNAEIVKLSALKLHPWELNGSATHKVSNYQSTFFLTHHYDPIVNTLFENPLIQPVTSLLYR